MPAEDVDPTSLLDATKAGQTVKDKEPFPYSFLEIIDADHFAINRLAGRIRKVLGSNTVTSRLPELKSLLLEVTWRLIRHDFSEDIVMRPAFVSVLGDYGVEMVERDRADHAGGRDLLLNILRELDLATEESVEQSRQERVAKVARMVTEAFDELGEHMKVESGEVLPRFESMISADLSRRLAREYAGTLLMTPQLRRMGDEIEGQNGEAVFKGDLEEYIHTTPAELKQRYSSILEDTKTQAGRYWFDKVTDTELRKFQIDKRPTSDTVDVPEGVKQSEQRKTPKIPSNALGLPVRWDRSGKGRL